MDNETNNLFAIIISGYAAILSTVSLIWNIANSILDKTSRIKVDARVYHSYLSTTGDSRTVEGGKVLCVTVVNSSKKTKYINKPKLKLSYKVLVGEKKLDEVNLLILNSKRVWPIELKPESVVVFNYPLCKEGTEWFLSKDKDNKKFKILVTDTINKKYYSNKMKINILRELVEFNSSMEEENFRLTLEAYNNEI